MQIQVYRLHWGLVDSKKKRRTLLFVCLFHNLLGPAHTNSSATGLGYLWLKEPAIKSAAAAKTQRFPSIFRPPRGTAADYDDLSADFLFTLFLFVLLIGEVKSSSIFGSPQSSI